jgi:hypothetical protein
MKKKKKTINNEKYRNNKGKCFWISRPRNILGLKYSDLVKKKYNIEFQNK